MAGGGRLRFGIVRDGWFGVAGEVRGRSDRVSRVSEPIGRGSGGGPCRIGSGDAVRRKFAAGSGRFRPVRVDAGRLRWGDSGTLVRLVVRVRGGESRSGAVMLGSACRRPNTPRDVTNRRGIGAWVV